MPYFKHETAIIDEGAVIGDNTRIWHWVHICGGARIGERLDLPLQGHAETKCPATGQCYRLNAILSQFRSSGDASGHTEYKAIWHAHLEDKYLVGR